MFHRIIDEDLLNIYNRNIDWHRFDNKTVFVSGAYGMLASYIVFMLSFLYREKGINVKVIAQGRSENKAINRFSDVWNDNNFVYCSKDIVKDILLDIEADYFIHAAGLTDPRVYSVYPVEVIEPNTIGTYNLLSLAKKRHANGFLFFSSGDVYGKVDESIGIDETTIGRVDPIDEHACYGESKRLGESLCAAFYREYGIRTCSARIAHTYGPTMDIIHDSRVFSSFMKCAIEGKDIEILSDGLSKRSFCYIADAVAAFFIILLDGKGGEVYNVCNSQEFLSVRELADVVASISKKGKPKIIYADRKDSDPYLESRDNKSNRFIEKKLMMLGWECEFDCRKGFKRVYDYLRQA